MVEENTETPAEQPAENTAEQPVGETPTEQPDHHVKKELRDAVGKAVGIVVEAGSMLAGHSGEMVSAEGKVAENDTEQFIDRIDGEG